MKWRKIQDKNCGIRSNVCLFIQKFQMDIQLSNG